MRRHAPPPSGEPAVPEMLRLPQSWRFCQARADEHNFCRRWVMKGDDRFCPQHRRILYESVKRYKRAWRGGQAFKNAALTREWQLQVIQDAAELDKAIRATRKYMYWMRIELSLRQRHVRQFFSGGTSAWAPSISSSMYSAPIIAMLLAPLSNSSVSLPALTQRILQKRIRTMTKP